MLGAVALVVGVATYLYASALAAFQMGGSCKEFGFAVPDLNCRQASFYSLFGITMVVAGAATVALSFLQRRR